jgi:hypothetical protein
MALHHIGVDAQGGRIWIESAGNEKDILFTFTLLVTK